MNSNRPYLIRAIYEWIIDNGMTPYLLVMADQPGVVVPQDFVEDDKIILNISPTAVQQLEISNESVSFSARFSGHPMEVVVPVASASALYARENGQGMIFPEEDGQPPEPDPDNTKPDRPSLKLVK